MAKSAHIDIAAARAADGVLAVLAASDMKLPASAPSCVIPR